MTTETEFSPASARGVTVSEVNPQTAIEVLTALLGATRDRAARAALTLAINTIRLQQAQIQRITNGGR